MPIRQQQEELLPRFSPDRSKATRRNRQDNRPNSNCWGATFGCGYKDAEFAQRAVTASRPSQKSAMANVVPGRSNQGIQNTQTQARVRRKAQKTMFINNIPKPAFR
jgi:hypothetical protein